MSWTLASRGAGGDAGSAGSARLRAYQFFYDRGGGGTGARSCRARSAGNRPSFFCEWGLGGDRGGTQVSPAVFRGGGGAAVPPHQRPASKLSWHLLVRAPAGRQPRAGGKGRTTNVRYGQ